MERALKKLLKLFGKDIDLTHANRETYYVQEKFFNRLGKLIQSELLEVTDPQELLRQYLKLKYYIELAQGMNFEFVSMFFERLNEICIDKSGLPYALFESEYVAVVFSNDEILSREMANSAYEKALKLLPTEDKFLVNKIIFRYMIIFSVKDYEEDDELFCSQTEAIINFAKIYFKDEPNIAYWHMSCYTATLSLYNVKPLYLALQRELVDFCIREFGCNDNRTIEEKYMLACDLNPERDSDEILRLATDVKRFIFRSGKVTSWDWAALHEIAKVVNKINIRNPKYRMIQDFCRKNFTDEFLNGYHLPAHIRRKYRKEEDVQYLRRKIRRMSYSNPYRVDLMDKLRDIFKKRNMESEFLRLDKKIDKLRRKFLCLQR